MEYKFFNKTVFFPEQEILVVGDLHIGYDEMMIQSGVLAPITQVKEIIEQLRDIFDRVKSKGFKIKKIVFLGDIKHGFGYEKSEKFDFIQVYNFLKENFEEESIIFIKGNHDTIDYSFKNKLKNYYITEDKKIAFIHGHKSFPEVYDKKIKMIVMGHIHPSVVFRDKHTSKTEKYKCFLTGKFKGKEIVILPSFLHISIGKPVNNYEGDYKDYFSIIPKKELMKFRVHAVGKDKIYDFGNVNDLV